MKTPESEKMKNPIQMGDNFTPRGVPEFLGGTPPYVDRIVYADIEGRWIVSEG